MLKTALLQVREIKSKSEQKPKKRHFEIQTYSATTSSSTQTFAPIQKSITTQTPKFRKHTNEVKTEPTVDDPTVKKLIKPLKRKGIAENYIPSPKRQSMMPSLKSDNTRDSSFSPIKPVPKQKSKVKSEIKVNIQDNYTSTPIRCHEKQESNQYISYSEITRDVILSSKSSTALDRFNISD